MYSDDNISKMMKTKYLLFSATMIAMGLTACNPESRLAKDLEGSWTGAPEKLVDEANASATYIPVFTFVKSEKEAGGTVTIDALISTAGSSLSGLDRPGKPVGERTRIGQWQMAGHRRRRNIHNT